MRRLFSLSPLGAIKLAGAFALVLLVGACQQVSSPYVAAKPPQAVQQPAPPAPAVPVAPKAPAPLAPGVTAPISRSGTAALLAPLSGPQAMLGTALLNAAQLALFELGDDSFTMLSFDTRGTAEGAERAARQAIAQHADIIIGPLFSAEVKAVAPLARQAGVPVLAFTTDRTAAGDGVYLLGFLPGPQALRVIAQAGADGRTRLGVLAPSNDYGRLLVDFLSNTLPAGGPAITSLQYYDPATLDWTAATRRLIKSDPKTPGDPGFDAVLLPDDGQRLRAIAGALASQGVDPARVKFLGTMLWQDEHPGADPALTGAWYAAPPASSHADFEQRYQKAFGARAPRLASLGYDGMALAAVLAKRHAHDYSAPVLTNPTGFVGVDGLFRLLPDGTADRGYAVFEAAASGPDREIAPAPAAFQAAY